MGELGETKSGSVCRLAYMVWVDRLSDGIRENPKYCKTVLQCM